ncbi:T9SS type B sorting domain-containing protein [Zhouia sp. CL16]|nr:T9SS type B sorting domain-containing protein [Zhouia amylolytica]
MFSCERNEGWSRVFKLSDFGIAPNEQFVINSGEVALSKSNSGAILQFNIYSIDENFPEFFHSLYPRTLLGSRGIGKAPVINNGPQIVKVDFEEPIIIPAGVDRILVSVQKIEDPYNPESAEVFIAGTKEDTGTSWYEGCENNNKLTPTTDLTTPVPNANFYINVTGEVFNTLITGATTRLSHNVCDDIINTNIHSCTSSYIYWARAFNLEEFGISSNEEFIITSGQVGINKVGWLPEISFNIYEIDENFPASFSESNLIGSSQYQTLRPNSSINPQIVQIDFETPIVIPAGVKRILVEVHKGIVYGDGLAFIAGSTQDNDLSWQRGCTNVAGGPNFGNDEYVSTAEFGKPDANFYINVTGNVNHVTNKFQMNIVNICSEFLKEFSINNMTNIKSVIWDFGDPNSGSENTSTDLSPFHDFSIDGIYTITATVTAKDGSVEVLTETIDVKEPPQAYGINNIYACEDSFNTGFSSSFDVSLVNQQVLGGQVDKVVTFIDGSGNEYSSLPNPFTNTVKNRETISVRVAHKDNLCCYSETTFDLIINPLPDISKVKDIVQCDDDNDGFTEFSLSQLETIVKANNPNYKVTFFHENGEEILNHDLVTNKIIHEETITVSVLNTDSNCSIDNTFKLIVSPIPVALQIGPLIGCDDNNDGISEYFDTSNVEGQILNGQKGMKVSYFDQNGNQIVGPLSNPYTNKEPFNEDVIIRVTNPNTGCFDETVLEFRTATQPIINKPDDIYACDIGNGFAKFNTELIEKEIIGNQQGLTIYYYDDNGNQLSSPLPKLFSNTVPNSQTIYVRVEDSSNPNCYSETSVDLIVKSLPDINLKKEYFICDSEPFISLTVKSGYSSYEWYFEDGDLISSTHEANVKKEGLYTLRVTEEANNVICHNEFTFSLAQSNRANIEFVNYGALGNNYIEIVANGSGSFEYSINGVDYQDSNYFTNVAGGTYQVFVRDKEGCGKDSKEISIIDYPKFFTPNGDGHNDTWHLYGRESLDYHTVDIFDRYGRLLTKLNRNSEGWDGKLYNKDLPSGDYWFKLNLIRGKAITGHFSLIR